MKSVQTMDPSLMVSSTALVFQLVANTQTNTRAGTRAQKRTRRDFTTQTRQ